MASDTLHHSVLLREVVDALDPADGQLDPADGDNGGYILVIIKMRPVPIPRVLLVVSSPLRSSMQHDMHTRHRIDRGQSSVLSHYGKAVHTLCVRICTVRNMHATCDEPAPQVLRHGPPHFD